MDGFIAQSKLSYELLLIPCEFNDQIIKMYVLPIVRDTAVKVYCVISFCNTS